MHTYDTSAIDVLSILNINQFQCARALMTPTDIFLQFLKNVKVPYVCNGFFNEKNIQVCLVLEGTSFVKVRDSGVKNNQHQALSTRVLLTE